MKTRPPSSTASRRALRLATVLALAAVLPAAAKAPDASRFEAVEWLPGEGARARIEASRGVVLVDLYADY